MKIKHTIGEIIDRTREKEKHSKAVLLLPLIPTFIVGITVLIQTPSWDLSRMIIYPLAIAFVYWISLVVILDVIFGHSIYQVLSPILNRKIKRVFNSPNRIDRIEQQLESQNTLITNSKLEAILSQIAIDFQNLDNKKMPEIVTTIHQDIAKLKIEIEEIKNNMRLGQNQLFPCSECKKSFQAISPDPTFSNPLRDKCDVCDMTNRPIFKRWTYPCDCGHTNVIYWHHKDGHTQAEIQMAEKLFYGSG